MITEHGKFLLELSTESVARFYLTRGCVACVADALNLLYRAFRQVCGPTAMQAGLC